MSSLIGKMLAAARRPAADQPPVSYAPPGSPVLSALAGGSRSRDETYMRTYGSTGTVFAIVSLLSRATARPEWHLYRKARGVRANDLDDDNRVEVITHAALDAWTRPNPFTTRHEFVEATQQHLDLTGEMWWLVVRAGSSSTGVPLALWPVRPDRMRPVPHPEQFIAGYVYTGPNGEQVPLKLNDVVWTKYPHPLDPYRGLGPVQSILTDIDAARYSAEWNRNFFLNSAEPGGIIQYPEELSDDEYQDFTTRWREGHQGVAAAHRVAVLEKGMQWVDRSYSMRDMQFTELRGVSRDVIREAFRVNKFMLGTTDDVNRAQAEAATALFDRQHTVERLDRIRMALNERFLPMFYPGRRPADIDVEFDYDSPVPADRAADNAELVAKAQAALALANAGYDLASIVDAVGLPPMDIAPRPVAVPAQPAPDGGPLPGETADEPSGAGTPDSDTPPEPADDDQAVALLRDLFTDTDRSWLTRPHNGTRV